MKAAFSAVLALALVACAGRQAAVQTTSATLPAPNEVGEYHVDWPSEGTGVPRAITIQLGPDLYQWCANVTPRFGLDESETYVQYKAQLLALASCLNHAGMEDRRVLLVGRADDRGGDAYNYALGMRRAHAIKTFLVSVGLAADRIDVSSLGEVDAKRQKPEYSYQYDRRVDVIVTGGAHHP